MADRPCALCGSIGSEHFAREAGYDLLRCSACRAVCVSPQPDQETLAAAYEARIRARGKDYWSAYLGNERSHRSHARSILGILRAHRRPPGRLLDIGCGPGFLLDEARRAGWIVCGVDVAEPFAAWGREKLGLDVRCGVLEDLGFSAGDFDVVVMVDVLSHLRSPRGTLAEVNRVLRPGGVLVLQAGNRAEAATKREDDDWETPLHLFHLTREGLRRLLEVSGFGVERLIVAPRIEGPAWARRIARRLPFAAPLHRALRRLRGILCSCERAADSTVYVVGEKRGEPAPHVLGQ